jgi:hypothetical protein
MLGRHIRLAGVQLIETALSPKLANPTAIFNPTIPAQQGWLTRKSPVPTASAAVAKVVATPSTS